MNIDRWIERIYIERDFGRSIATSVSGLIGLAIYLLSEDWAIGAFSALIVFPLSRVIASSLHSSYMNRKEGEGELAEARNAFKRLSNEEKEVLFEFVRIGGSVMSWSYANKVNLPEPAVSSLMQRRLLYSTMTADGMSEAFGITVEIFDVAKESFDESENF